MQSTLKISNQHYKSYGYKRFTDELQKFNLEIFLQNSDIIYLSNHVGVNQNYDYITSMAYISGYVEERYAYKTNKNIVSYISNFFKIKYNDFLEYDTYCIEVYHNHTLLLSINAVEDVYIINQNCYQYKL